jgi:nicotinamide-nucleotide amidase
MRASIITIGDEILIGQVIDTNSAWIGQKLSDIGVALEKRYAVGDDHAHIMNTLNEAVDISDIVILTGGLGPTKDDITKKALAEFMGVGMYFDHEVWERIVRIFDKLERPVSESHKEQSFMPEGVQLLRNSMGTAPGMLFHHKDTYIVSLPGVPYEMKAIMEEEIFPWLRSLTSHNIVHKTLMTCGAGETVIENEIQDIVNHLPDHIKVAYLPGLGVVRVRLTIKGEKSRELLSAELERYLSPIENKLSDYIYGYDDKSLEEYIHDLCLQKKITIATAESCTGGNVASRIIRIPGSSGYFNGSIIAYSNDMKIKMLKVPQEILTKHGAVSEQAVMAMVDGAISQLNVHVAVATSGIAGPDGGTVEKPVGTIWICAGNATEKKSLLLKAGKNREKNIELASTYALNMLRKMIQDTRAV